MAENKKKRKWLSTQALKEFINEITEEELNAEELYNETNQIHDSHRLADTEVVSQSELGELIQEQETFSEGLSENLDLEKQPEENYSNQQSELQQVYDELVALKKDAEVRLQEMEQENESLKEKLDFERIRVGDELAVRDEEWQIKFAEIEEEKQTTEAMIAELKSNLKGSRKS